MSSEFNECAARAKGGDRPAMAELVGLLRPRLVGMVRASRIHRNDRADAVQEVLIQVVRCVEKFDPELGDFENYVMSSVSRLLMTLHGREGERHATEVLCEPVDVMAEPPRGQFALEHLDGLSHERREIVRDYYGVDRPRSFSVNQIAARRKISNAKVKAELQEARRQMRG